MNKVPDVGIAYSQGVPCDALDNFEEEIRSRGLIVVSEEQPAGGSYACPEWFMLSVAAVFISKAYFDGFLKEAGKDHYLILKSALSKLANRVMNKSELEPLLIGTKGKISSKNPFSLAFSVYAEAHDGSRFKLLIPKNSDGPYCERAVSRFLEFVEGFHKSRYFLGDIGFDESVPAPGGHIFVWFNQDKDAIEWLDESKYR